MKRVCSFIVKNMAVFVLLVSIVAVLQPPWFTWVGPRISWMLGIVMFGMGMTLKVEDFHAILQHPRNVFIGFVAQFVIMPSVAWILVKTFQIPPEVAIGVILVGTCPGGTASNVITYLAKGDVALSVSISMATTLFAPIVTPILTWLLADAWIDVSLTAMMLSIAEMVLLPVILGVVIHHFFNTFTRRCLPYLPVISVITIVLIVGGVVSLSADVLWQVGIIIALVVICHNLMGLFLGYCAAKLFHMELPQAKAVSIEVGMQNSGLAASLAVMYFTPAAAIPGAIFSVWHNISGSLVANYFTRKEKLASPVIHGMKTE